MNWKTIRIILGVSFLISLFFFFNVGRAKWEVFFVWLLPNLVAFIWSFNQISKDKSKDKKEETDAFAQSYHENKDSLVLHTDKGSIVLYNPFRGLFVLGGAGSGKSESIAVPILKELIKKNYCGIVYDFKYPTLAKEVDTFISELKKEINHYRIDLDNPLKSDRVNPLHPNNVPSEIYADEYAKTIYTNLVPSSIQKSDFWSDSAINLLSACIWFLRDEHPQICDLPHVCALVCTDANSLLTLLQNNPSTASKTSSMYTALKEQASGQLAGVIGTLQTAISKINIPSLMYIFGGNDVSLNINDPQNPTILTIGNNPTLSNVYAPLCSLLINVSSKQMNQPDKHKSFMLLDESPTVYIPNLDQIPNTGRSNKIATILMCQDYSQLCNGYGDKLAETLFASCASHFYGRVSKADDRLSKQFGKVDRTFVTHGNSKQSMKFFEHTKSTSQSVQERDVIKASEFLNFEVGEFAGILAESNVKQFRGRFRILEPRHYAPIVSTKDLHREKIEKDIKNQYLIVREDIRKLIAFYNEEESTENKGAILNNTTTNSKDDEKGNVFDIFGDGC